MYAADRAGARDRFQHGERLVLELREHCPAIVGDPNLCIYPGAGIPNRGRANLCPRGVSTERPLLFARAMR